MLNINIVNSTTAEVENFYRVPIDLAQSWSGIEETCKLIEKLSKNKQDFYETMKQIASENSQLDTRACFTKVLINSELLLKKDLIYYTYDEIVMMLQNLALFEGFSSKAMYISYVSILLNYLQWGYDQTPRLRTNVLSSSDLPHYSKMVDQTDFIDKILTWNEMKMLIQKLDYEMNDVVLTNCMEGLTFNEIVNLERENVNKAKETRIVNTGVRKFKLSEVAYEKTLAFANASEGYIKLKGGKDGYFPLSDSPYVLRLTKRKTNSFTKIPKSSLSTRLKQDLINAGYEGTFKDCRTSSMLNYYLDLEESCKTKLEKDKLYLKINERFNMNFSTQALLLSINKSQLQILRDKRSQEKEYYNRFQ